MLVSCWAGGTGGREKLLRICVKIPEHNTSQSDLYPENSLGQTELPQTRHGTLSLVESPLKSPEHRPECVSVDINIKCFTRFSPQVWPQLRGCCLSWIWRWKKEHLDQLMLWQMPEGHLCPDTDEAQIKPHGSSSLFLPKVPNTSAVGLPLYFFLT